MTSLILVTGGTGTLGKLVVPRLRESGANLGNERGGGHVTWEEFLAARAGA